MKFIVRLFPEITIKSRSVRQQQVKQLKKNIRQIVKQISEQARVGGCWDMIEVEVAEGTPDAVVARISDALTCIPGINHIFEAQEYDLPDVATICELTRQAVGDSLNGKTFAVRVQRAGVHEFRSIDLEREVGGYLHTHLPTAGVRLKDPQVPVMLQVHHQRLFIVSRRREGMGGYPLGTQENVATLISGGFDSSVAAYQMLQRGVYTHFIFFRLGGSAHESGVKEVAHAIWSRYGASHRVKFVTVPFEGVVEKILTDVDDSQMGVILKRCMMRCADQIARRLKTTALVTGEAISQVSSQTLTNLQVIDQSVERLILRPLITCNKQSIVDQAKAIGVAEMAAAIPEYCGVISRRPTIRARLPLIEAEEAKLGDQVLKDAVAAAIYQPITEVLQQSPSEQSVEIADPTATSERAVVILDVRAPLEAEAAPLQVRGFEVQPLPFFQVQSRFAQLDPEREYWLYCDQGVMSQLQVRNLLDAGHRNVKVCPAQIAELTAER